MIHPTRTNLLMLRERARSVLNSSRILKARKQALIKEFLETTRPFIQSRQEIRIVYGAALDELSLSLGREGAAAVASVAAVTQREFPVAITGRSIWGLHYKEVTATEAAVRTADSRGYDYYSTTPHLEEGIGGFEKILEAMIELAAFEGKLKRLGDEILKTTRQVRVLEERVLPGLHTRIHAIAEHINERDREAYCRLKRFKDLRRRPDRPRDCKGA